MIRTEIGTPKSQRITFFIFVSNACASTQPNTIQAFGKVRNVDMKRSSGACRSIAGRDASRCLG